MSAPTVEPGIWPPTPPHLRSLGRLDLGDQGVIDRAGHKVRRRVRCVDDGSWWGWATLNGVVERVAWCEKSLVWRIVQ